MNKLFDEDESEDEMGIFSLINLTNQLPKPTSRISYKPVLTASPASSASSASPASPAPSSMTLTMTSPLAPLASLSSTVVDYWKDQSLELANLLLEPIVASPSTLTSTNIVDFWKDGSEIYRNNEMTFDLLSETETQNDQDELSPTLEMYQCYPQYQYYPLPSSPSKRGVVYVAANPCSSRDLVSVADTTYPLSLTRHWSVQQQPIRLFSESKIKTIYNTIVRDLQLYPSSFRLLDNYAPLVLNIPSSEQYSNSTDSDENCDQPLVSSFTRWESCPIVNCGCPYPKTHEHFREEIESPLSAPTTMTLAQARAPAQTTTPDDTNPTLTSLSLSTENLVEYEPETVTATETAPAQTDENADATYFQEFVKYISSYFA